MTLQDVNNSNQDRTEAQELSRRREPADRLPSKSEECWESHHGRADS